jgi:hypothetical protein
MIQRDKKVVGVLRFFDAPLQSVKLAIQENG